MTPCARGCCWSPFSCARAYTCACHWDDKRPATSGGADATYADPTSRDAIRNVMKERREK